MYNHRIIIAGLKNDIRKIFEYKEFDNSQIDQAIKTIYENDANTNQPIINNYFKRLAAWIMARNFQPHEIIESLEKAIRATKNRSDEEKLQVDDIRVRLDSVIIKDNKFPTYTELSEYVHEKYPTIIVDEKQPTKQQNDNIVFNNNGITIYEINNVDESRAAATDTNWCIGYRGGNNMWQYYRDHHASTFFIVHDENPPTPQQAKVAIDFQKDRITLTDIPNHTGIQLTNGWKWEDYQNYLMEKGVNFNATRINPETNEEELIFKNKPIDKKQALQNATFRNLINLNIEDLKKWQNQRSVIVKDTIDFFEELTNPVKTSDRREKYEIDNPDAVNYLSRWLALGAPVDDDVFKFIVNSTSNKPLLEKYLNSNVNLSTNQLDLIKDNRSWLTTYIRKQIQKLESARPAERVLRNDLFLDLINLNNDPLLLEYVKIANTTTETPIIIGGFGVNQRYSSQAHYLIQDPQYKEIIKENIATQPQFSVPLEIKLYDFDNEKDKQLFLNLENKYALEKFIYDDNRFLNLQDSSQRLIDIKDATFANVFDNQLRHRLNEFDFKKYTISPAGYILASLFFTTRRISWEHTIRDAYIKILENQKDPEAKLKIDNFYDQLNQNVNDPTFWKSIIIKLPDYFRDASLHLKNEYYDKLLQRIPSNIKNNKEIIAALLDNEKTPPTYIAGLYDIEDNYTQDLVDIILEKHVKDFKTFMTFFSWIKDAKSNLPFDVLEKLMQTNPEIIMDVQKDPYIEDYMKDFSRGYTKTDIGKKILERYFESNLDTDNIDINFVYNSYFKDKKKVSLQDQLFLNRNQPEILGDLINYFGVFVIAKLNPEIVANITNLYPQLKKTIQEEIKKTGDLFYTPEEIKYFEDEENIESNIESNTNIDQDTPDDNDTDVFKEAKIKTLLKIANILDKKQKYILADVITMKMKSPL